MWLVVSCVVNRNRKVGANSRDPISTSTMQRHRNPNHWIYTLTNCFTLWQISTHMDPGDGLQISRSYQLSNHCCRHVSQKNSIISCYQNQRKAFLEPSANTRWYDGWSFLVEMLTVNISCASSVRFFFFCFVLFEGFGVTASCRFCWALFSGCSPDGPQA